jgi:chloramphenicol-sensitive protein RarD
MAVLGMLQYLSPTIQMLLGLWVFHEAFSAERMAGFIVIWSALVVYMGEGLWTSRRTVSAA